MNIRRNDEGMSYFVPHVVTILVYQRHKSEIVNWNASGFPIAVNGHWWLATAGHVINDLRELTKSGALKQITLCDAWTSPSGVGHPIPFPTSPEHWIVLGNDVDVLDLGAIRLGPLMVENLKQGKIEVVPERDWRNVPTEFDHYFLLGAPGEMIKREPISGIPTVMSIARGVFRLTKVARPDVAKVTSHERFYGRISQGDPEATVTLDGIEGVSGGPVFGGKNVPGGVRMWTIAVQSAWMRDARTITADYLVTLGQALAAIDSPQS
jgi:hypothetical protein